MSLVECVVDMGGVLLRVVVQRSAVGEAVVVCEPVWLSLVECVVNMGGVVVRWLVEHKNSGEGGREVMLRICLVDMKKYLSLAKKYR